MHYQQNPYHPPEPRVIALAVVKPRPTLWQSLWLELATVIVASLGAFYLAAAFH